MRALRGLCCWGLLGCASTTALALPGPIDRLENIPSAMAVDGERQYIEQVNAFFNRLARIPDRRLWKQDDYWATPDEVMKAGGGDCEDLAAAKYFSLRELGVPAERMRLVYARVFDAARQRIEPHVVLWYRRNGSREWLVLDSLRNDVLPRARRDDLLSWLAFNESQVARLDREGRENSLGGTDLLKPWARLLARQQMQDKVALVIAIHTL